MQGDLERYFDFNATTPLSAAAREAWLRAADRHWQNPSSLYRDAGLTNQALEAAREHLAGWLGCDAERVVFTAGATEGNNQVFSSLARRLAGDQQVVISAIEHPSVREAARQWLGAARVVELPISAEGVLEPDTLAERLKTHHQRAALVSVMAANNESGTLQPWRDLARLCRESGVLFHCDAAQWIGKLDPAGLGECDLVTGSAHKFGGPKGVGFVVLPEHGAHPWRLLFGGPQEEGRRAGTENYPGVAAMVAALEQALTTAPGNAEGRDGFEKTMTESFPGLRVIGAGAERLWNTSLFVMPRHSNLKWLARLSYRGFSISTGSACSSGREGSSVVVRALGADEQELRRVLRVSGGRDTSPAAWQTLTAAFVEVSQELDG